MRWWRGVSAWASGTSELRHALNAFFTHESKKMCPADRTLFDDAQGIRRRCTTSPHPPTSSCLRVNQWRPAMLRIAAPVILA